MDDRLTVNDFNLTTDGLYLVKRWVRGDRWMNIDIKIGKEGAKGIEKIEWTSVNVIVDSVFGDEETHQKKANEALDFLIRISGLYSDEDIKLIDGYVLVGLEIIYPFRHSDPMYINYVLHFDFDSTRWVDTYGHLLVKFVNKHVVGMERVQV